MREMFLGTVLELAENGRLPDRWIRAGIRRMCAQKLREQAATHGGDPAAAVARFAATMREGPIAPVPEKANAQHYELPPEFFTRVLGARRKYSACHWSEEAHSLDQAEEEALRISCERAGIADGMQILDLGCGWGSLSLWMAENFPKSKIRAVSNSPLQRRFIESQRHDRRLDNLDVVTADMNDFDPRGSYDRIVSIEMFEHMRNYERLLHRIRGWLNRDGALFIHIFCHRLYAYPFAEEGAGNWMGRYFFSGGIMPSRDLLDRFDADMRISRRWEWDGTHYARTAEAWLQKLDSDPDGVMSILRAHYDPREARRWLHRWRIFFMSCAELFGFDCGQEWIVAHYLLTPRDR